VGVNKVNKETETCFSNGLTDKEIGREQADGQKDRQKDRQKDNQTDRHKEQPTACHLLEQSVTVTIPLLSEVAILKAE